MKKKYSFKWHRYGAIELFKDSTSFAFLQGDEAYELAHELDNACIRSQQQIMSDYDQGDLQ
jgi:hypothetical protein